MKKQFKKVLAMVLAMVMMLFVVPVSAASGSSSDLKAYLPPKTATKTMTLQSTKEAWYLGSIVFSKKARNVTVSSSDPRVATVKTVKQSSDTIQIMVTPIKLGTTVITTKVSGKTYKNKVAIKNYVNPISSVKLGNTTISGSKFNKKDIYTLKYSKYAKKDNIISVIKAKKGWGLYEIFEKVNGKTDILHSVNTFKPRSGKGNYQLIFQFYHFKTEQIVNVTFNFK